MFDKVLQNVLEGVEEFFLAFVFFGSKSHIEPQILLIEMFLCNIKGVDLIRWDFRTIVQTLIQQLFLIECAKDY